MPTSRFRLLMRFDAASCSPDRTTQHVHNFAGSAPLFFSGCIGRQLLGGHINIPNGLPVVAALFFDCFRGAFNVGVWFKLQRKKLYIVV